MVSVNFTECRKQAHYAKCRYAECRYSECRFAEHRGAVSLDKLKY
jgi:hypothetical protein